MSSLYRTALWHRQRKSGVTSPVCAETALFLAVQGELPLEGLLVERERWRIPTLVCSVYEMGVFSRAHCLLTCKTHVSDISYAVVYTTEISRQSTTYFLLKLK